MNKFERGIDPKEALNIGRSQYVKQISDQFLKDLKKRFPDLLYDFINIFKTEENGYIEFDLGIFSTAGMNSLSDHIDKLIYRKYRKKLVVVDDNYWENIVGVKNMPEESSFYNEESIFVKVI
jgi:hypothetical protein